MPSLDFSDRPRKRQTDKAQISVLKDFGFGQNKEVIIALCGPNPKETIKLYSSMYKYCILVEQDKNVFETISYRSLPNNITLYNADIFDVIEIYKDVITGIDFDICGVFSVNEYKATAKALSRLTQNKIFVRLNSSTRIKDGDEIINHFYKCIQEEQKENFKILSENKINYNDIGHVPMRRYQLILERKESNDTVIQEYVNNIDIEKDIYIKQQIKKETDFNIELDTSAELERIRKIVELGGGRRQYFPEEKTRIINYIADHGYSKYKAAKLLGISYITLTSWIG